MVAGITAPKQSTPNNDFSQAQKGPNTIQVSGPIATPAVAPVYSPTGQSKVATGPRIVGGSPIIGGGEIQPEISLTSELFGDLGEDSRAPITPKTISSQKGGPTELQGVAPIPRISPNAHIVGFPTQSAGSFYSLFNNYNNQLGGTSNSEWLGNYINNNTTPPTTVLPTTPISNPAYFTQTQKISVGGDQTSNPLFQWSAPIGSTILGVPITYALSIPSDGSGLEYLPVGFQNQNQKAYQTNGYNLTISPSGTIEISKNGVEIANTPAQGIVTASQTAGLATNLNTAENSYIAGIATPTQIALLTNNGYLPSTLGQGASPSAAFSTPSPYTIGLPSPLLHALAPSLNHNVPSVQPLSLTNPSSALNVLPLISPNNNNNTGILNQLKGDIYNLGDYLIQSPYVSYNPSQPLSSNYLRANLIGAGANAFDFLNNNPIQEYATNQNRMQALVNLGYLPKDFPLVVQGLETAPLVAGAPTAAALGLIAPSIAGSALSNIASFAAFHGGLGLLTSQGRTPYGFGSNVLSGAAVGGALGPLSYLAKAAVPETLLGRTALSAFNLGNYMASVTALEYLNNGLVPSSTVLRNAYIQGAVLGGVIPAGSALSTTISDALAQIGASSFGDRIAGLLASAGITGTANAAAGAALGSQTPLLNFAAGAIIPNIGTIADNFGPRIRTFEPNTDASTTGLVWQVGSRDIPFISYISEGVDKRLVLGTPAFSDINDLATSAGVNQNNANLIISDFANKVTQKTLDNAVADGTLNPDYAKLYKNTLDLVRASQAYGKEISKPIQLKLTMDPTRYTPEDQEAIKNIIKTYGTTYRLYGTASVGVNLADLADEYGAGVFRGAHDVDLQQIDLTSSDPATVAKDIAEKLQAATGKAYTVDPEKPGLVVSPDGFHVFDIHSAEASPTTGTEESQVIPNTMFGLKASPDITIDGVKVSPIQNTLLGKAFSSMTPRLDAEGQFTLSPAEYRAKDLADLYAIQTRVLQAVGLPDDPAVQEANRAINLGLMTNEDYQNALNNPISTDTAVNALAQQDYIAPLSPVPNISANSINTALPNQTSVNAPNLSNLVSQSSPTTIPSAPINLGTLPSGLPSPLPNIAPNAISSPSSLPVLVPDPAGQTYLSALSSLTNKGYINRSELINLVNSGAISPYVYNLLSQQMENYYNQYTSPGQSLASNVSLPQSYISQYTLPQSIPPYIYESPSPGYGYEQPQTLSDYLSSVPSRKSPYYYPTKKKIPVYPAPIGGIAPILKDIASLRKNPPGGSNNIIYLPDLTSLLYDITGSRIPSEDERGIGVRPIIEPEEPKNAISNSKRVIYA